MKSCVNLYCLAAIAVSANLFAVGAEAGFPKVGAPRAITSGPKEHLLASYFAIDSWSPNKRYVSVLETDFNGRLPKAGERCTIALVDLEDGNRLIPVASTACWNFQEAAMCHWMDDDTLAYNDVRDGKFKTVVKNWKTGEERILPRPISALSQDRSWAVSINYARLELTRPDYGYAGDGQDPLVDETWPETDGIWTMDMKSGETKLVCSISRSHEFMPEPKTVPGKPGHPLAYHCHTVISKDSKRIFFLARAVDWFDLKTQKASTWETTAFTINKDGSDLRRCFRDGWAASHFNWAPDGSQRMLVTVVWDADKHGYNWHKNAWSTVEFEVGREDQVRRIGAGLLDFDWHCVYAPNCKFMSGEGYWTKSFERAHIIARLSDGMTMPIGAYYVPPEYRGSYWRCDLHTRFRPDGRQLAFNSVHEGSRQVYVQDLSWDD